MIKAVGQYEGEAAVLLGLEAQNMALLREGQPIKVNLRHLGPGQDTDLPDITVVIFFAGADEKKRLLDAAIASGADVKIHTDGRQLDG